MNTKICTSIKQSKKLIELGIEVKTANMCWSIDIPDLPTLLAYPITDCDNWENKIPAWSVYDLFELMPERIKINGELSFCLSMKKSPTGYGFTYGTDETTFCNDSLIDAAYEMVVWLKENRR